MAFLFAEGRSDCFLPIIQDGGVVRGLVVWLTDSWCAGASEEVVVTPHDSFGNSGASGGRLAAELVQEEGRPLDADPTPCHVVESTTGGLPALLEPTA